MIPSFPRSAWECLSRRSASSRRRPGNGRGAAAEAFPRRAWERARRDPRDLYGPAGFPVMLGMAKRPRTGGPPMPDARTCPDCGSELPARAPEGLCPRCLLGAGLNSEALSVGRGGDVGATMSLGSGGVLETIPRPSAPSRASCSATPTPASSRRWSGPIARRATTRPATGSTARSPAAAWAPCSRAATPTSAATSPSRSSARTSATTPTWSAGSSRRPRSAASSSTRGSCRSTSWAPSPTAGRSSR